MHIVIDRDAMKMVAAADTSKWASLIAWVDFPNVAILLVDSEFGRSWTELSDTEMKLLYRNMSGQEPPEYSICVEQLRAYSKSWPAYHKSEVVLEAEAAKLPEQAGGKPPFQPVQVPYSDTQGADPKPAEKAVITQEEAKAASAPKRAPRDPSAPPAAPRTAGATGKVWAIADAILAEGVLTDIRAIRKEVIERCGKDGINPGTAATQYGKWKASKGL